MGLFRPYQQHDNSEASHTPKTATDYAARAGKGKQGPTPTRAEAEAARRARLRPKLTHKELKRAERDADRKRRGQNMRSFEDRPERVLLRNYVDSRWAVTEFMMPISIVLLVMVLFGSAIPIVLWVSTILLWAMIGASIINIWLFWRGFKKELRERVPHAKYQGLLWGMASRMMGMRQVRSPGPMIKRGQSY